MSITKDLVAASATPIVLSILKKGESYGYDIIKQIKELSNGELEWTDGMLYPVLHRLEKKEFIQARWGVAENGRKRKYYNLKEAGLKELSTQHKQWYIVNSILAKLQSPEDNVCFN